MPWIAGAALLAFDGAGAWCLERHGKPFEAVLTALWYVGPMNHTAGIDFTGTASGANANHDALIYFALSGVLLGAAFVGRARQLRSD